MTLIAPAPGRLYTPRRQNCNSALGLRVVVGTVTGQIGGEETLAPEKFAQGFAAVLISALFVIWQWLAVGVAHVFQNLLCLNFVNLEKCRY